MLTLAAESPRTPDGVALLNDAIAELNHRYPEEVLCRAFVPEDAEVPRAVFVVARWNDNPIGCGVLRPFTEKIGELKRMFVREEARGKGIGRALLRFLETQAHDFGYSSIVLETGLRQPEAIGLYEAQGYERIPPWPEFQANRLSLCYEKQLTPSCFTSDAAKERTNRELWLQEPGGDLTIRENESR